MLIETSKDLRAAVRQGCYAWPGGYPLYFVTFDGESLSCAAVRDEYKQVLRAVRHQLQDGWRVMALEINWEEADLACAHTGERIECAYGD